MSHLPLITKFKKFYSNLASQEWAGLDDLYAGDICFCDPIHRVEGIKNLHHYIAELCENLTSCTFDYLDEVVLDGTAYIKWDMHYSHPKIKAGDKLILRGVSQIEFDERGIYYHEDFYDVGAMLYEHIPIIGMGVRWIKKRLASSSK